jgi:hypothetical protein
MSTKLTLVSRKSTITAPNATIRSAPRLEKWDILSNLSLVGEIYGHPAFTDGEVICTNRVQLIHFGDMEAVTNDGTYRLGRKGT